MGYAELIQTVEKLSPERQAEVLDFAQFLATRSGTKPAFDDWTREDFSRASMAQALRGMEDDPVAYSISDIKERFV